MKAVSWFFAAALAFFTAASAGELNFTQTNWDGIYTAGDKIVWTAKPGTKPVPGASYSYKVLSDGAVEIGQGRFDLKNGSAEITVTRNQPGSIYVIVDRDPAPGPTPEEAAAINAALKALTTKKNPELKSIYAKYPELCLISEPCAVKPAPGWLPPLEAHTAVLGAVVSPSKITPAAPRPADFDAFWAGKLAELAKVPFNPVLTEIAPPMPGIKFYKVKLDSLNSHVQGYLAVPDKKGPFPAMVQYQWAGVYALIPWNCANRATQGWLCLNVSSHDMPPDQSTGVPTNYQEVGNTSRETSYFLNMYLRDTQALGWLRSRPEWNGKTLLVTGASMGGQQSLVTAGLNPGKVTAVVVSQPAGGDVMAGANGRMAAYPFWDLKNPAVAATAPYFDTVNFASKITAPTVAAVGLIDSTCPPGSIIAAMNQITVPHEIISMPDSEHGHVTPDKMGAYNQRSEEIFATLLHGGVLVPNENVSTRP